MDYFQNTGGNKFYIDTRITKDIFMSQILPQGELVRRAAAYIAEERRDNPRLALHQLIDAAGMRFNLSPLESEALQALFSPVSADTAAVGNRSDRA